MFNSRVLLSPNKNRLIDGYFAARSSQQNCLVSCKVSECASDWCKQNHRRRLTLKAETDSSSDKLLGVIKAGQSIIRTLYYLQLGLVVLSCSGLVVAVRWIVIGLCSGLIASIGIC